MWGNQQSAPVLQWEGNRPPSSSGRTSEEDGGTTWLDVVVGRCSAPRAQDPRPRQPAPLPLGMILPPRGLQLSSSDSSPEQPAPNPTRRTRASRTTLPYAIISAGAHPKSRRMRHTAVQEAGPGRPPVVVVQEAGRTPSCGPTRQGTIFFSMYI